MLRRVLTFYRREEDKRISSVQGNFLESVYPPLVRIVIRGRRELTMASRSISDRCLPSVDIETLAKRFDRADVVQALILLGSYARGDAGPHSDVDLVRFVLPGTKLTDDGTHLHEERLLINISSFASDEYEQWFLDPLQATRWIAGLRVARVLIDREQFFSDGLQRRAREFLWDAEMQRRANVEVSRRMVGWSEEVHKGLEGLRRENDLGRLLNACHGLSWGLAEVLQLRLGVLVSSDNNAFEEVEEALGDQHQEIVHLRRLVFGVTGTPTLRQRVIAGLALYALIAEQMSHAEQGNDARLIQMTVEQIRAILPAYL